MGYHLFNSRLHQSRDSGALEAFKEEIMDSGWHTASGGFELHMFKDHIGREFNRKAFNWGLTGLMFTPYDAGFRPAIQEGHPEPHLMTIGGDYLETIGGQHLQLI